LVFNSIIDTLLTQKKELFKESGKMELCLQRLRSYLTTEQTAKFLLIMEKYKSKKELNLFKLWGIKKITNMQAPTNNRIFDKIALKPNQGSFQESSEEDDEIGLPESGEEEEAAGHKHSYSRH
jgi:hypothetical protein